MQIEYTKQAENVLKTARSAAKELRHPYIGTEHLLLGLRRVFTGVAGQILATNGVNENEILKVIGELISPTEEVVFEGKAERSPRLEYLLENSRREAERFQASEVGTEHMLMAIVRDSECVAARILTTLNISLTKIYQDIFEAAGIDPAEFSEEAGSGRRGQPGMLEQYCTDLTEKAADGKLDPVVGRMEEIERLMQVLSRRTKNNPCLVGEPGVGKTAIIEGLAQRIVSGMVPESMKHKHILTLDLAALIAGSKYRGEFEDRMKRLIQEVKSSSDILLFLDEVHTMIGAGGAEGAMDASNILKPSLARGELQLIGATTISEYRKYIEKDAALERRFQPITVEEPDSAQSIQILEGLKGKYESHHHVTIEPGALEAAVKLSERYISDRNLPDKAIDVLDEACSKANLNGFKVPDNLTKTEEILQSLMKEKEQAVAEGRFAEASMLNQEQQAVEKKLESIKKRFNKNQASHQICVTEQQIAEVVSVWTKIPVQKLGESESARLRKLEQTLQKRVIGQEEAVTAVAKAVKRGRVGLKSPNRPIGSFLFLGPTGEYMEKHSVSKMIGSPPGYVGHEEGGQLSEKVRRNPYAVILFDEIEKAHPDVFNILLQVLDDGHITDSQGRKIDFRNTVIIMTSNAGAKAIVEPKKLGFAAKEDPQDDYKKMKSNVMDEVKQLFRPEFLNRIDEIIVFHALSAENLKKIAGLLCKEFAVRVQSQLNIQLHIRDSVKKHIVEVGTDTKYGARPLRRAVQNELEDKMAEAILAGEIHSDMEVDVSFSKKQIKFLPKVTKN